MGYFRSAAYDKVSEAVDQVSSAIASLVEVVVKECHGYDDMSPERRRQLQETMNELITIKRCLKED